MIKNYDALEDTPWYMIYKELKVPFDFSEL